MPSLVQPEKVLGRMINRRYVMQWQWLQSGIYNESLPYTWQVVQYELK